MLLMRCASMAFATSLASSEEYVLVCRIFEGGTQEYTEARREAACWPVSVGGAPMRTRDGYKRSFIAVPAERNSGLDRIVKGVFGR